MALKYCCLSILIAIATIAAGMICVPLFFLGLIFFAVFLAAPCAYFITNTAIFGMDEIREKYRREGIQLSGQVVKRWTNSGNAKIGPEHFVNVVYQTTGEERYTKVLQVTRAVQSQTCLDLMVLPQYPRSAEQIDRLTEGGGNEENMFLGLFGRCWSFIWMCAFNIGFERMILIEVLKDSTTIVLIIVCEVVIAWITGYFLVRAHRNAYLREMLFGATLYGSGELHPAPMPHIVYQELFPSSTKSFQTIIWIIFTDYAKLLGGVPVGFLVCLYLLVFGGGYCLWRPFLVGDKTKELFAEEYMTKGTELEGTVVHRTAGKVKVQYDVVGTSLYTAQRYEKTLPIPRYRTGQCPASFESKPVLDNPRLTVLPDLPTSARLTDEIELCEQIYRKDHVCMIFAITLVAMQTAYATLVIGGLLLPEIPKRDMALIYVTLQLSLGCMSAFLHSRYILSSVRHDAKKCLSSGQYDAKQIEIDENIDVDEGIEVVTLLLDDSNNSITTLSL